MDYNEHKKLRFENLKREMKNQCISIDDLAIRLRRSTNNVSNIFGGTKPLGDKFLYNSTLAIGVHPDKMYATSNACVAATINIMPHEVPAFIPPKPRTREKKRKSAK